MAATSDTPDLRGAPWAGAFDVLARDLDTDVKNGLDPDAVPDKLARFGPNRLRGAKRKSALAILFNQFKSAISVLLMLAAVGAWFLGDRMEATAIAVVVGVNALIGFLTELHAARSMEALQALTPGEAVVRRGGKRRKVPSEEVVPGDLLIVEGGESVAADARLVKVSALQVDESALTGESAPVDKALDPLPMNAALADRTNMLFKGTVVTRGHAEALVVATGIKTEIGRISALVADDQERSTPLEQRLESLGIRLLWVSVAIGVVVVGTGLVVGKNPWFMIESGVALTVASIPEGLPIVATVALARGMWRMAKRHALINRLSAVETLGSVSVICTDKTGTLTENRMAVTQVTLADPEGAPVQSEQLREGSFELLRIGALCNTASLGHKEDEHEGRRKPFGDPMEIALLEAAVKLNLHRKDLVGEFPEVHKHAFDPAIKMMATVHKTGSGFLIAVKGAPEAVLQACSTVGGRPLDDATRELWKEANGAMASGGLRVLALASKQARDSGEAPFEGLALLGFVGLFDPPRKDVREALAACRSAGIRVLMLTGDQAATAISVAQAVGLAEQGDQAIVGGETGDSAVYARMTPEQKLKLIERLQASGEVVAMTGDGVNDAPALKRSDIGIAMGQRGTDVAREAADMILKDDSFKTIVAAIEQGRGIFDNIRKFVVYLISCNISEILAVGLTAATSTPLLLPLQVLFLNLVTDVFPALALGMTKAKRGAMRERPYAKGQQIMGREQWTQVAVFGSLITAATAGAVLIGIYGMHVSPERITTIAFLTLALAQLWHVFDMRSPDSNFIRNEVTENPHVWASVGLCVGICLAAVYWPLLAKVLGLVAPTPIEWGLVLGMSLAPMAGAQLYLRLSRPSTGT